MQYLMIENEGVCPVEGFTILGLSSNRHDQSAIGQFGSGNKHGVLTLMRFGLIPTIYLGPDCLEFHLEKRDYQGRQWNQVLYSVNSGTKKELSMAAEYGELDWTAVDMALREFISNALDASNGDRTKIWVGLVETIKAKNGSTRIYVPSTPEVISYFHRLSSMFLHFAGLDKQTLIKKDKPGHARVYRKGVFVREIKAIADSVYDYNFDDSLHIDEARNLDDWACSNAAKQIFRKGEGLVPIFRRIVRDTNFWEAHFSDYGLESCVQKFKDEWIRVWEEEFGDALIAPPSIVPVLDRIIRKGFTVKIIHSESWYNAMAANGIPTALSMIDDVNENGDLLLEASPRLVGCVDRVWSWLRDVDMTKGRNKPPVKMFRSIMESESTKMGYYKKGTIYINEENQGSVQTVLEELAHYVTGSGDNSRDFQDFAFNGWARLAEMVG